MRVASRIDGLDYYAQKFMMHHRLAKRRRSIWADFIDGADMQALILVSPHACVCLARRSGRAPQTRMSGTGTWLGVARDQKIGMSHREFMVGARSDIVAPLSRLLDELLGHLEVLKKEPPMSQSQSTDTLAAASQADAQTE